VYKNGDSLRVHKHSCKGVKDEKKETVINQVANTINNDNSTTNNDNSITNNNNITNNVTLVINDIDSINGIDYILKDPRFTEKILKWVTDKNGLLKYMDEKYYNKERPENRGIRKIDKESIELHMKGKWNKYDNITALGAIIESLRLDWGQLVGNIRYEYEDDYENNKKEFVTFKREVGDPLEMDVEITDDEDETKEKTKQIVNVNGENVWKDVKDEVMVKKEKKWKEKILKNVK
jgi:hypothetical protein